MAWEDRQLLNRRYQASMNSEDAFITGYFLTWLEIPERVYKVYEKLFGGEPDNLKVLAPASGSDMTLMLSALCTGVPSIPDSTLNQTSMNGIGGTKWGVTTNLETSSTFSLKFREMQCMPVIKTIASWFTMIRDPHSGASLLVGDDYTKRNFFGRFTLAWLKPDMQTIEMGARFEGIFPTKYPTDLLNSDNGSVEPLEPEIEFHCDSVWTDNQAITQAQNIVTTRFNQMAPFHSSATPAIYGQKVQ